MKEKLRLKEKVVMEKDSRPSAAQIKQLSTTYNVTEVLMFLVRNKG